MTQPTDTTPAPAASPQPDAQPQPQSAPTTDPTADHPQSNPDTERPVLTAQERLGLPKDTPVFQIDKAVGTDQLVSELTAVGATQVLVQIQPGQVDPMDGTAPVNVYVVGKVTADAVNKVLAAHTANPDFGLTDQQKADQAAIAKARDPKATLTTDDMAAALRALLVPAPQPEVTA